MNDHDTIHTFIAKLGLWHCRVQKEIAVLFPTLDIALEKNKVNLEDVFKAKLEYHLQNLKEKYGYYFPDLGNVKLTDWKMTKNLLYQ